MTEKNKAAQEMARLSHAGPTSEKRKENARQNGAKGGRPKLMAWETQKGRREVARIMDLLKCDERKAIDAFVKSGI